MPLLRDEVLRSHRLTTARNGARALTRSDPSWTPRPLTARTSPRDEAAARLKRAAIQVVADEGLAGLTCDALCACAGATQAELCERWPDPRDVLRDAIDEQLHVSRLPNSGNLLSDLVAYVRGYLSRYREPAFVSCLFHVMAEGRQDPQIGAKLLVGFIARRARNRILIERAIARGELRKGVDPDAILDAVLQMGISWLASGKIPPPREMKASISRLVVPTG